MYDAVADPYCYPGTTVLKNIPGFRTQPELDAFEAVSTMQRADEPLPEGRLSVRHYQAVHHHLFRDVYSWAGQFRTVRMAKDQSAFCYPEYIRREMAVLFSDLRRRGSLKGRTVTQFSMEAAEFIATLNAIHPFREGNGRTQTLFLALVADRAGHRLDLDKLDPSSFFDAMVKSFKGETKVLSEQIQHLLR